MIYLLIIIAITVVYGPNFMAKRILNKYNKKEYFSGNGFDLATIILDKMGISGVRVEETKTGDHYDPKNKIIHLTRAQCGKKTLTAVAVATHEVAHAIQDYENYKPLRTRSRMINVAVKLEKIGAGILLVIPIITVITRVPAAGFLMFLGGFATLCIPLFVHLFTLPTEFDASFKRALPVLKAGKFIPEEDIPAVRNILFACALTYVASALTGLLNIWRWIRILKR